MSILIYLDIIFDNDTLKSSSKDFVSSMKSSLINYCQYSTIGIHSKGVLLYNNNTHMRFQLTDSFSSPTCERFMEPILYTLDGIPQINSLVNDISVLHGLLNIVLNYKQVKNIELRFSFGEVNEDEYRTFEIMLCEFKKIVLEQYLNLYNDILIPTIKLIINKV